MALLHQDMPANYCALTFDDGPGPYTAALLDLLAKRGITATFFVLGQNAERHPALIKRMLAEGHEIANHSFSHADMRRLKAENQFLEMKNTLDVLRALGAEAHYFRPPYGRYNAQTVAQAESLGMTLILWSLDSQDWKRHVSRLEGLRSVSPVEQQSFSGMRGVLLFHDTHKHTVDDMADILDALVADGCERFVTISEYMRKAPHEEEQRLFTQAPNQGRGEMPPPSLVGQKPPPAGDILPQPPEEQQDQRLFRARMRTQAAHPVNTQEQALPAPIRIQPAHNNNPDRTVAAVPEALMAGIVTSEQPVPLMRGQTENPAQISLVRAAPPAASRPQASAATKGQIPRLRSNPDMILPAHKTVQGKREPQGENGPG